jgi:hypothetical protein
MDTINPLSKPFTAMAAPDDVIATFWPSTKTALWDNQHSQKKRAQNRIVIVIFV